MRVRTVNIVQYERHPDTGEVLLSEETIKAALLYKSITRYAYIKHTKDRYTDEDEVDDNLKGSLKNDHWHITIQFKNAIELSTIAKRFNISENYIDVPKGRGAFLDCVEYLTHRSPKQQELGKYRYDDSEVVANFDWLAALENRDRNGEVDLPSVMTMV